jgi:hypothetical protein
MTLENEIATRQTDRRVRRVIKARLCLARAPAAQQTVSLVRIQPCLRLAKDLPVEAQGSAKS